VRPALKTSELNLSKIGKTRTFCSGENQILDLVITILKDIIDENILAVLIIRSDPRLQLLLPILLRLSSDIFKAGRTNKDLTSLLVAAFSRLYVLYEHCHLIVVLQWTQTILLII
jgi:hypothetical protein